MTLMKVDKIGKSYVWLWVCLFLWHSGVAHAGRSPIWAMVDPTQSFDSFSWAGVDSHLTPAMVESLQKSGLVSSSRDMISVFWIDEKIWAVFPCQLAVLEWNGQSWKNLYKGYSAGFNCQPQFFVRNGVLHCYGRYGFWRTHSEIMYFDSKKGSWENLHASHIPVYYAGTGAFLSGDTFLTFMGQRIHQSSELHQYEPHGYAYSFTTQEWSPIHSSLTQSPRDFGWFNGRVFDLPQYGIKHFDFNSELGLLVFDKQDYSIYFAKLDWKTFDEFHITLAFDDALVVYDREGKATDFNPREALQQESFHRIGQITATSPPYFWHQKNVWWGGIIGVLFLLSGVFWFWKKKKNTTSVLGEKPSPQVDEETLLLINALLAHETILWDVDGFDQFLGLADLDNLDYRRVRRSRLIKSINTLAVQRLGRELILRTKSTEDRRVILYQIRKSAQDSV